MSLIHVRAGVRAGFRMLCATAAVACAFTLPTASQAQNDGSLNAMFKSGNPNYGAVASAPTPRAARAKATSQPRAERSSSTRRASRGVQVASLGGGGYSAPKPRSLGGGGGINWVASSSCLNGTLRGIVSHVAANYGAVTVSSTCRSNERNRRVGGAPKSYHLSGDAVDFRVHGNVSGAIAYLGGRSGGYKHMGGGLFHVDTGPTRRF
jgi:Peptidase M15